MILSYRGDHYGHLDTLNINIRPLFYILLTEQDVARTLVPILATKEALASLANDPIMLDWLIRSYRHLKHQNLSTFDDFINIRVIIFVVPFLATKEELAPLASNFIMSRRSIRLLRHLECQNLSISSDFAEMNIWFPKFLLTLRNVYRILNNGQILTFKVSK